MFTKFQRFYNSIKLLADLAMLSVAFFAAYGTRFALLPAESTPPLADTLLTLGMVWVIFPIVFRQASLYTTNRNRTHIAEVFEIFKATVLATLVLVAISYFVRERYSRLTILVFASYSFLGVAAIRLATRSAFNTLRRRGFNVKSVLVVGGGDLGQRFIDTIVDHQELGFRVIGVLTRHKDHKEKSRVTQGGAAILGSFDDLGRVLDAHPVDQVVLALPLEEQPLLKPLMEELALRTVDVKLVPDLYNYITLRSGLEEFGGMPIISLQGAPLEGWNLIAKRAFDVLAAGVALIVLSPVLALISIAVKLTSPGPVFYFQERMGMDGHLFSMFKFRTMQVDAEKQGPRFATPGDHRTTPIGAFLRSFSLDELPQFWNVLVGDMSLVGPRPERPMFIETFKQQIPKYHLRHMVKSGITGWAQIHGLRGDTSIQKRIDYDLYYIENWSMAFDLKILMRTALGGFLSKNAY